MGVQQYFAEAIPAPVAVIYELVPGRWLTRLHRGLAERLRDRQGRILDIGCGPGQLASALRELNREVDIVGIDISPQMVRIARRRCRRAAGIGFEVMDANRMSFASESFDFVTSSFALHHWKSPRRVFNEIHRLLKPGCEAWIYDGLAEAPIKAIRKWVQPFPGFPPVWLLRLVFKTHGFGEADYEDGVRAQAQASSFGGCRLEPEMVFMKLVLTKPAAGQT